MTEADSGGTNPRGAARMAIVAFLAFNLSMGTMFGPFGVLVGPIEQKLHVTREISTLAVPVVTFVISLLAPFAGGLAGRVSLRLMMMASSLLMAVGFVVLAMADSVPMLIGAYALLIGPGLSVCGVVGPSTLVTRWFRVNRGRALGLATTPALMAATPLLTAAVVASYGLSSAYWMLAGLMLLCLAATALAVDYPARTVSASVFASEGVATDAAGELPASSLIRDSRFWRLALAAGLYNAVIVMFSTELVPFATGTGIDVTSAALLLTFYLIGTLIGTPLVGWSADKLGGARMIGLLCVSLGVWQALLVLQPSYASLALLSGLVGLQGSAMPSCLGLALSQQLGESSFAKAYGASTLVGLPFAVLGVPIASGIYVHAGSYAGAFLVATIILALGALLALSVRQSRVALRPT
jgi:MFS family permease